MIEGIPRYLDVHPRLEITSAFCPREQKRYLANLCVCSLAFSKVKPEEKKETPGRCLHMSPDDHDRDLSISELSLSDQTLKPFSLLAPPAPPEPDIDTEESEESEEPVVQQSQKQSAKAREEKLQSDIFILRKLNASFELFNEALQDTGSANQVILHFIHNPHPSQQLIFSALLLSSNKLRHFLTNM